MNKTHVIPSILSEESHVESKASLLSKGKTKYSIGNVNISTEVQIPGLLVWTKWYPQHTRVRQLTEH